MTSLLIGVPYELISGSFPSDPVAMPARRVQLSLQSSFASAPSGVAVDLEGSVDNENYFPILNGDFSETAGEILTINTSATSIRLNGSITGGTGPSIMVVAKA